MNNSLSEKIKALAAEFAPGIIQIRRHLHANPEFYRKRNLIPLILFVRH